MYALAVSSRSLVTGSLSRPVPGLTPYYRIEHFKDLLVSSLQCVQIPVKHNTHTRLVAILQAQQVL